jgi:hypothetical protein
MTDYGEQYVVNQTYRSSSDSNKDQFQKWLNGPIDTGIRNSGGIRAIVNPETKERELIVFVSDSGPTQTNPSGKVSSPWKKELHGTGWMRKHDIVPIPEMQEEMGRLGKIITKRMHSGIVQVHRPSSYSRSRNRAMSPSVEYAESRE